MALGSRWNAVALAVGFSLLAGAARAETFEVLARPGTTYEEREADRSRCREAVRRIPTRDFDRSETMLPYAYVPYTSPASAAGGAVGVVIAYLIILEMDLEAKRSAIVTTCMHNLGYVPITLTESEARSWRRGRNGFERTFLRGDMTARFPVRRVRPLPNYDDAPMTHGAYRIDVDALALTASRVQGPVTVVARGPASRARSARLGASVEGRAPRFRFFADEGAVFHLVDHRTQAEPLLRPSQATWCGPVRVVWNPGAAPQPGREVGDTFCFTYAGEAYVVYDAPGPEWASAPPYEQSFRFTHDAPIELVEPATDDPGPLEVVISAAPEADKVLVIASIRRGREESVLIGRRLPFVRNVAVLPLWTRQLVFTRTPDNALTAELTAGNGVGWREGG